MLTICDNPGAGWNNVDTDNYFTNYYKKNEMVDVVQQEIKSTTPQQFEEDHINLMTMKNINSLPAMVLCEGPLFNLLCGTVVPCQIFIRKQSLIAC
jgi:hypothetical protein